jgi:hypothetical protein
VSDKTTTEKMTAVEEIEEKEEGKVTTEDLWPVGIPPLEDAKHEEELGMLSTLEERIRFKYTPGKLDQILQIGGNSAEEAMKAHASSDTDDTDSPASVKVCPGCAGAGKVRLF